MCFAWQKHAYSHLYSMLLLQCAFCIASAGGDCRMFAYCFFLFHQLASSFFLSFIRTNAAWECFGLCSCWGFVPSFLPPASAFSNAKAWLRCLFLRNKIVPLHSNRWCETWFRLCNAWVEWKYEASKKGGMNKQWEATHQHRVFFNVPFGFHYLRSQPL